MVTAGGRPAIRARWVSRGAAAPHQLQAPGRQERWSVDSFFPPTLLVVVHVVALALALALPVLALALSVLALALPVLGLALPVKRLAFAVLALALSVRAPALSGLAPSTRRILLFLHYWPFAGFVSAGLSTE